MPPVTGAPPSLTVEAAPKRFRVYLGGQVVADSIACRMLFEAGHQPVLYFPRQDIAPGALAASAHRTACPRKGEASYWDLVVDGTRVTEAGWSYEQPTPAYADLAGAVAFYPGRVDECRVDGERVVAQPGDFYGGWITSDLVGPFKGALGTAGW